MNPDYIVSDFSRQVCAALDQLLVDMMAGKRPILILGAPPQHGKSDIVSRYLPAYFFGKYPDKRVAGLSYGSDLASDMNRDVQRIMMSDEYSKLFPESQLSSKRVVAADVEPKRNSETFEIVGRNGAYIAQGVGGPLTGKKVDLGIIDDPIKNAQEALSPTTKKGIWNWYVSTFVTRMSKASASIIMATRWAVDDLSGRIIESSPNARVLQFPAIDGSGKALVPELHPIEKLLETKALLGSYFWAAMYQQSPTVEGGRIIKGDWFVRYDEAPRFKKIIITADTAQKTKEHNDFSVFIVAGLAHDGGIYLIDLIRGKWEAPELEQKTADVWNKYKAQKPTAIAIEDKASGTGLIQKIKREKQIPVKAVQVENDKYTRLLGVQGYIESGYVHIPRNATWANDFITECEAFTADDTHTHDDQVDALVMAINELKTGNVTVWDVL